MIADDQLCLLNDWTLAMTSLANALDLTVSLLQGRPRDLAQGLAARFVSLAKQDPPQQIPQRPANTPLPTKEIEMPNQASIFKAPQSLQDPPNQQTMHPATWASRAAQGASQEDWQTANPKLHKKAKQPGQQKLKQPDKIDHHIFLRLPASSSLQAIRLHGIRVTLTGKVLDGIIQVQGILMLWVLCLYKDLRP
jgi:hypothetical protein